MWKYILCCGWRNLAADLQRAWLEPQTVSGRTKDPMISWCYVAFLNITRGGFLLVDCLEDKVEMLITFEWFLVKRDAVRQSKFNFPSQSYCGNWIILPGRQNWEQVVKILPKSCDPTAWNAKMWLGNIQTTCRNILLPRQNSPAPAVSPLKAVLQLIFRTYI